METNIDNSSHKKLINTHEVKTPEKKSNLFPVLINVIGLQVLSSKPFGFTLSVFLVMSPTLLLNNMNNFS